MVRSIACEGEIPTASFVESMGNSSKSVLLLLVAVVADDVCLFCCLFW